MAWGDEEPTEVLEHVDPWPFTAQGRLYQRLEHELAEAQAVLKVGSLVLQKQETQRKLNRARKGRRGASHPV
jgi:hypothetical protein